MMSDNTISVREQARQKLLEALSDFSQQHADSRPVGPTPTNPSGADRDAFAAQSEGSKFGGIVKTIGDGTGLVGGGIGETIAGIKVANDRAKAVADAQKGSFPTPYAVAPEFEKMIEVYLDALESDARDKAAD